MKRPLSALAACCVLVLTMSACGGDDGGSSGGAGSGGGGDSGGLDLISDGKLTVCSDIPFPPFEMQEGDGYTGFDMDLMREVADGLGLELVVQDSGFDGLQSGLSLNSGQCDIVASAMTITEKRAENLDFTEPYYDSQQSLLVPAGSDIASIEDLAGRSVGVQQGTTGQSYATENAPEDTDIQSFPSDAEMFPAIQAGNVDALLQDLPVNLEHTRDGDFEIVEEYATDEQYGFAVKKGNTGLLDAVDEQLQTLRDDGTYQEIFDSYFSTE